MMVAGVVFAAASVALGLGPTIGSVPVLLVGVLLMSASFALGNVPLNLESVIIERAMGRTVVPHFHAAFSIGAQNARSHREDGFKLPEGVRLLGRLRAGAHTDVRAGAAVQVSVVVDAEDLPQLQFDWV